MSEVSLRDYIEAILEERLRGHLVEHALIDQALDKTNERVDGRIDKTNERVDARIDRLEGRLTPLEQFRSRAVGFGVLLSLISGVVGAIIRGFFG